MIKNVNYLNKVHNKTLYHLLQLPTNCYTYLCYN